MFTKGGWETFKSEKYCPFTVPPLKESNQKNNQNPKILPKLNNKALLDAKI